MTGISRDAQSAQAAAREKTGEFGTQAHNESGLVDVATEPRMVLVPVNAGEVGTVFRALPAPGDHECKAACWRRNKKDGSIGTMCEYGHSVGRHDGKRGFGGSAFEASLGYLPAYAPFNLVPAPEGM